LTQFNPKVKIFELEELGVGLSFSLYVLTIDGECSVRAFISALDKKNKTQIVSLLKSILEHGLPHNPQRFRKVGPNTFELKARSGARLLGFFGGSNMPKSLILTHGFWKPHEKILRRQVNRAEELRKEYFRIANATDGVRL